MNDPDIVNEIESELEAQLDVMDKAEEIETVELQETLTNIQLIKDIEEMIFYMIKLKLEQDKAVPKEFLGRFKILLIGGKSWGQKSLRVNTESDPYVYYTLMYKIGELDTILDGTYHGHIIEVKNLRKMIANTLCHVWREKFAAFTPQEIWARKVRNSKKLIKLRYKKDASELFDLVELGRCKGTFNTTVTIVDKYTGLKEHFTWSGPFDPRYLSTPMKITLSEHLRIADIARYGPDIEKEENELLNREIVEFVEKQNIEKDLGRDKQND